MLPIHNADYDLDYYILYDMLTMFFKHTVKQMLMINYDLRPPMNKDQIVLVSITDLNFIHVIKNQLYLGTNFCYSL